VLLRTVVDVPGIAIAEPKWLAVLLLRTAHCDAPGEFWFAVLVRRPPEGLYESS
jgi:hypothetical protein